MVMQIEVITCWYNEEFLAPFFLKQYNWVDRITILFDKDSNDKTFEILKQTNASVIPFYFPDKMDDIIKVELITNLYSRSSADWIIIVDADEFVFINRKILESVELNFNLLRVALYNVYRHVSEQDLDNSKTIREQRRHGYLHQMYIKPIIIRPGLEIKWLPGNHVINGKSGVIKVSPIIYQGAHWANADPCFCVERRVKNRRDRQSRTNLANRLTIQHHNITEESVLAECMEHENDPFVF